MAILSTTVASITDAQNFTLAGGSTLDNAYDSYAVQITNQANTAQFVFAIIEMYVGSSKLVTLFEDPGYPWTLAVGDPVDILAALNKRRRVSQLPALTPTLNTELVGLEAGVVGRGLVDTVFSLFPAATVGQAGKVTTAAQSFAGAKTFTGLVDGSAQTAAAANNFMTRALGDARYQLLSVPSIKRTAITATGTFTYQPETQWAIVELVAGGGGGGGTAAIATGQAAGAEGGNGGGYVMKFVDVGALPSRTVNFVIGAQGLGVSGANGTAGGNSSYSDGVSSLLCYGGSGGSMTNGVSDQSFTADKAPDAASTGGDVNRPGEPASGAFQQGATIHTTINARSGRGGGGPFAIGGRAQYARSTSTTPVSSNGTNGLAWGAGGGGAVAVNANSAKIGGNGTAGIAYVLEFP